MKKFLFAALLVTVAVGSSFAAYKLTPGAGTATFDCNSISAPTCESQLPQGDQTPIYDAQTGNQITPGSSVYDLNYEAL